MPYTAIICIYHILFRPKSSEIGPIEREHCKKFQLREKANEREPKPHKNCVKCLGVNIDDKLNYNQHIGTQISKASKAFWRTKRLFYSKHLNSKVKILYYQALIRRIITYGCPIWSYQIIIQHISFPNGKNSHIWKKMHQDLPEYIQIRTQRIQK